MPCAVRQRGLEVLLYPAPHTAPFGTSKVSCTGAGGGVGGGRLQNELAYVGEMQLKNLD